MADAASKAAAAPTLTPRDVEILVAAIRCPKTGEFEVDYGKLAPLIGSKTVASARTSWSVLRKKLNSDTAPTMAPKADGAPTKAAQTPTKSKAAPTAKTPKSSSKKESKNEIKDDDAKTREPAEPASETDGLTGTPDANGDAAMDDVDDIAPTSDVAAGKVNGASATEAADVKTPDQVEASVVVETLAKDKGKGKAKAATPGPEPLATAQLTPSPSPAPAADAASMEVATLAKKPKAKVIKKEKPTLASVPTTLGHDNADAEASGNKTPKTPTSTAGKKRGRKSKAEKEAEAAAAAKAANGEEGGAGGDADDDAVDEKPAKKRKTPVKKSAAKKDTTAPETPASAASSTITTLAEITPSSPALADVDTTTPSKKPAKPRAPRKPKDPNAPPSARSKAGKAKAAKEAEEKAAAEAAAAEKLKAKQAKEVADSIDVLTGKKVVEAGKAKDPGEAETERQGSGEEENGDYESPNETTPSEVDAAMNTAIGATLDDAEADKRSEVSSAVGMVEKDDIEKKIAGAARVIAVVGTEVKTAVEGETEADAGAVAGAETEGIASAN